MNLSGIYARVRNARFVRDERGSVTIEFVLWVVPFILMLAGTVDASILYLTHTEMWNVSRDIARRISIGDITPADAADEAQNELSFFGNHYTVAADIKDGDVIVAIQTTFKDASMFGIFSAFGAKLTSRVVMRKEPT